MLLEVLSRSLVARTTTAAVLLVSVLIAVPMAVLIQADVRATQAELVIRAELATKIVLDDAASALWDLDPEEAVTALAPLRSIDAFAEAEILGTRGERFAFYRKPDARPVTEDSSTTATVPLEHADRSGNRRAIGTLLVRLDATQTNTAIREDVLLLTAVGAGILLLVIIGVVWATRGVTVPIAGMTRAMSDLAAGDVSVEVPGRHRDDEIGRMAAALRTFRQNAIDLRAAKERAEQAVASKAKFMAAASHDLRQPAQSLLMLSAILRRNATSPETADSARKIEQVVMTLKQLLDDLLEVSRLDAGGVTATMGVHDIGDLFLALDAQFGPVARNKGLALAVSPLHGGVVTDRVLFLRLLGNLIDNAIRYTAAGSVQLVGLEAGSQIVVEVRDSGIGIPEDRLEAIFEEFHQIGNPERNRDNGIGLGLSIVKRLSTVLNHPVKVRSVLGKGSVFSVAIPLAAEPAKPPELESVRIDGAASETAAPADVAVLVIDDDSFVLNGLTQFLTDAGRRVHGVSTVARALDDLRDGVIRPDILVADYHLSATENGIDFITQVWSLLEARVPAILISGRLDGEVMRRAGDLGIAVVAKPILPDRLSTLIGQMAKRERPLSVIQPSK
ncbi:signal transduction histidine kinase/CheY-like chemotaxis protein [Azospirillum agricola]|uniref:hybrid sensor histidine kinase/response regulator n=1 Tax=Azospirillum agricola TaxID=1720247 RepID=UPI001AE6AE07|nr:hybrid sensor histidine kinase/response regulator [Azospirillum agricola]MBP2232785.1 signal transduction histidine kinase/CheY-like chemotaxis protein [Azospirillum agricola]